jgi:hypothetical protein
MAFRHFTGDVTALAKEMKNRVTFYCSKHTSETTDLRGKMLNEVGIQVANALSLFGKDESPVATIMSDGKAIVFTGSVWLNGWYPFERLPSETFTWLYLACVGKKYDGRRIVSSTWTYRVKI